MFAVLSDLTGLQLTGLLIAMLAVFAGAVVQGLSGMGLGLVAAQIFIALDPAIGPGPLLAMAIPLSSIIMLRELSSVDCEGLILSLRGRAGGSLIAGIVISWLSVAAYELVFGVLVLAAVLLSMMGLRVAKTVQNLIFAGFTSGLMGTLTGAGSPTIALIYHRSDGATVRSTLSAFFLVSSIISLGVLVLVGKMGLHQWAMTAVGLPLVLVGFLASNIAVWRLSNDAVRIFVLALAGGSAVLLILRSLSTFLR